MDMEQPSTLYDKYSFSMGKLKSGRDPKWWNGDDKSTLQHKELYFKISQIRKVEPDYQKYIS